MWNIHWKYEWTYITVCLNFSNFHTRIKPYCKCNTIMLYSRYNTCEPCINLSLTACTRLSKSIFWLWSARLATDILVLLVALHVTLSSGCRNSTTQHENLYLTLNIIFVTVKHFTFPNWNFFNFLRDYCYFTFPYTLLLK